MGVIKGTASFEVKSSDRNRELENFASLEPRVCEVLLYSLLKKLPLKDLNTYEHFELSEKNSYLNLNNVIRRLFV